VKLRQTLVGFLRAGAWRYRTSAPTDRIGRLS